MMAAGRAAARGRSVVVLEKNNQLGKKLAISGGGRCNICNAQEDVNLLLSHYGKANKFLYSPFSQFGMAETFEFFEDLGLPLKIEALQRAFPASEKASDVVAALKRYMEQGKVRVQLNTTVQGFVVEQGEISGVRTNKEVLTATSYVLATGGASHPETGSTGDGFRWLSEIGYAVKTPTPTIVPLAVDDAWIKSLAGIALDDVKVTFFVWGKKQFAVKGRVLCTHFGISGPTVLNAAGKVADLLHDGTVTAAIDLFPKVDLGNLDKHITKVFDDNKNRDVKNVLKFIVPTGTSVAILSLLGTLDPDKKVHSVSRDERKALVSLLKALPLTITGLMGFERAVVADGGLAISEIESKTMRSRKHQNLFVTGDVLDINRPSGGYSLQLCWTTGWVAGSNV